jgi:hypoxanthine phosphoribosyltransferase
MAAASVVASVRTAHSDSVDERRIAYARDSLEKVLYTSEEIDERVRALGKEITAEYEGKEVVVVGLLSGVFMFFSDLVRNIQCTHKIDFMVVSSYGESSVSSANVKIKKDLSMSVEGKHVSMLRSRLLSTRDHNTICFPCLFFKVLLVDDICDSGMTMACLKSLLEDRGAIVKTCVLLDKKARRSADVKVLGGHNRITSLALISRSRLSCPYYSQCIQRLTTWV